MLCLCKLVVTSGQKMMKVWHNITEPTSCCTFHSAIWIHNVYNKWENDYLWGFLGSMQPRCQRFKSWKSSRIIVFYQPHFVHYNLLFPSQFRNVDARYNDDVLMNEDKQKTRILSSHLNMNMIVRLNHQRLIRAQ